MNRPDNILAYDEMDLKLGIKSSLPHVKSTLALAILLWGVRIILLNWFIQNRTGTRP